MATPTPNLDRLRRRWFARLIARRTGETLLLLLVLLPLTFIVPLLIWRPPLSAAFSPALLGGAVACALLAAAVCGPAWAMLSSDRLLAWLDRQADSHMLLSTAWELGRRPAGRGQPTDVEQAVIARGERLAGRGDAFAGVTTRLIATRLWILAPIALAAFALTAWIVSQGRAAPNDAPLGPGGQPVAAAAASSAGGTLEQLVAVASDSGQKDVAAELQRTAEQVAADPARAAAALAAQREALARQLAAARSALEAMSNLSTGPGGEVYAMLVARPAESPEQSAAAVAAAAEKWKALAPGDRAELAAALRASAARTADAALADRLARAADALEAGRMDDVLAELKEIARRVQPLARRGALLARVVDELDAALAAAPAPSAETNVPPLAQAPRAATVGPAARADDDPHWQSARSDAVRLLQSRSLSADQQRAVRQYFDLGQ